MKSPSHVNNTITSAVTTSLLAASIATASPTIGSFPVEGPDDTVSVAAASVSGWYAAADAYEDSIEIRDIRGTLLHTITRAQIQALLPWMTLTGGPDGPAALAFSDTGRSLFILVTDSATPGDGQGSDAVLRFDAPSGQLSVFARLNVTANESSFEHPALLHFKGRLYVGTPNGVTTYTAGPNTQSGGLLGTSALPDGAAVRGLSIDRDNSRIYAASTTNLYRSPTTSLSWTTIGSIGGSPGAEIRALTWADHFGNTSGASRGLYVLRDQPAGALPHDILFIAAAQAQGTQPLAPIQYYSSNQILHDLAASADGRILIAADEDALTITESTDNRLSFDDWILDEFRQHVTLARGLISPDGEPSGWVIDGDVPPSASRFHPASPDAAAWTVLMLIAANRVDNDQNAQSQVRTVLQRYAGLAPTGPAPLRNTDGIMIHWIEPSNGQIKSGWGDGYATLSTMKIVAAAARAMHAFPNDPAIVRAASRLIFNTRNWASYTPSQPVNGVDGLYYNGQAAGGPVSTSRSSPYNEGILFVEQAGVYGGANGLTAYNRWMNRALWPSATYLTGRPVTGDSPGNFQAAFLNVYPMLLSADYRHSTSWQTQVQNHRWSHAAWTDDNGPQYYTVFSAGTTPSGYNADNLSNGGHASDITTFTSLIALGAQNSGVNPLAEVVAGYHAYRKGARQTFKTGASLLYRRSNTDRTFTPNSAGLPDVTIGGLGLAETLSPGFVNEYLAIPYPALEQCPVDINADGVVNEEDLYALLQAPQDLSGNGVTDLADIQCLLNWLRRNEQTDTTTR